MNKTTHEKEASFVDPSDNISGKIRFFEVTTWQRFFSFALLLMFFGISFTA